MVQFRLEVVHQFAAGYTVAKKQMSFAHLFFFATFLQRRLCACDQDRPKYGRSSQGRAYAGRLLAIPSHIAYAPYKSCHPHQFAAGYTVAKKQMSFAHLFFSPRFCSAAYVRVVRIVRNTGYLKPED